MAIIFKFIIKNIQEKKFRTFLILLSVMLSTALFFASTAISGTIEQMYLQRMKKYFGSADIIIHPNEKSPSPYFYTSGAEGIRNLTYIVGAVESAAVYKNRQESVNIDLKGFRLSDLQAMNPCVINRQWQLQPFQGHKIIISRPTAEKYHLEIGSDLELILNDNRHRFRISAIAEPVGAFQDDGRSNTAVIPRETLANLMNASGRVSIIYIQLNDRLQIHDVINLLAKEYRRYTVREAISREELRQYTNMMAAPFMLMIVLVLMMSIFIIYTSFKVITRERLPVIGAFRSIGATKKATDWVLFTESLLYGAIGGILGCILGIGILYIMSVLMIPEWLRGSSTATISFNFLQMATAFGLALVLSFGSSFFPIIKISKIPLKEIILNSIEKPKRSKGRKFGTGIVLLGIAYGSPFLVPKEAIFPVTMLCMVLTIISVILMIPVLTSGLIQLFGRIFLYVFGNEGMLAAKNLRENKSILNNISLLAIGISSLLMINTLSYSVGKEVLTVYRNAKFDIWMGVGGADRNFKPRLFSVDGVRDVYGLYSTYNVEIDGRKDRIGWFAGIRDQSFFKFWNIKINGNQDVIQKFADKRNILLSSFLKEKLGVKAGDYLTIKTKRGNKEYQISGFFNSLINNGNFVMIPERYFKSDMMEHYYSDIFIQTSREPALVEKRLKKKFERERPFTMTMLDMEKENMKSNSQMFFILKGFSILALLIGIVGIFNNLIISFIERKRSLAMMRSLGMSHFQSLKMILIESLTGGVIGGSVGILAGILLISFVPGVLRSLNLNIPMHYSLFQFLFAMFSGIVITVVASISPAYQSVKVNIIEAIKYE